MATRLLALGASGGRHRRHEHRHPQHMWIMNVVWPVTALFGTVWIGWQHFTYGRPCDARQDACRHGRGPGTLEPTADAVSNHCGERRASLQQRLHAWRHSGRMARVRRAGSRGRIRLAEPLQREDLRGLDRGLYLCLPVRHGVPILHDRVDARVVLRSRHHRRHQADTLSLTAWQVVMYGFMAIAYFVIFHIGLGVKLATNTVEFWFMMQISMFCGFMTSYPVNRWLIQSASRKGCDASPPVGVSPL